MADRPSSLHERVRSRVRVETAQTAIRLFLEQGYDTTTVEDICAEAGLSRRTFFRYFRAKDDVVLVLLDDLAETGCKTFVESPSGDGLWSSLRRSMDPVVSSVDDDPAGSRALFRLIDESPALRSGYLARLDEWRTSLGVVIAAQDNGQLSPLHVHVIAAAALGAFSAAGTNWASAVSSGSFATLVDEAFAAVAPTVAGD